MYNSLKALKKEGVCVCVCVCMSVCLVRRVTEALDPFSPGSCFQRSGFEMHLQNEKFDDGRQAIVLGGNAVARTGVRSNIQSLGSVASDLGGRLHRFWPWHTTNSLQGILIPSLGHRVLPVCSLIFLSDLIVCGLKRENVSSSLHRVSSSALTPLSRMNLGALF